MIFPFGWTVLYAKTWRQKNLFKDNGSRKTPVLFEGLYFQENFKIQKFVLKNCTKKY